VIYRATKVIEWDAGHRVPYHRSACRNVHGHRYKLEVTLEGVIGTTVGVSAEGMVADFSDLKTTAMERIHFFFDHCFIMSHTDPLRTRLLAGPHTMWDTSLPGVRSVPLPLLERFKAEDFGWVQVVPGVPTAENLACWCYQLMTILDEPDRHVSGVKLWETPNSMAEYRP
jgi:6-pyruvoyltetrahydropterin/6-carboxytetrahydropterin synthase